MQSCMHCIKDCLATKRSRNTADLVFNGTSLFREKVGKMDKTDLLISYGDLLAKNNKIKKSQPLRV
jgi:hypothetical protein